MSTPSATSSAAGCLPLNYRTLHPRLVPRRDRWQFWWYGGYALTIDIDRILTSCKPVH